MKYYDIASKGFYEQNLQDRIEITDEYWQQLLNQQTHGGKIQAQDGQVVCVMPSEEEIVTGVKEAQKSSIQKQIKELDLKRIRALAEGGIKDESLGQTWLEYYTNQIVALRAEIANL